MWQGFQTITDHKGKDSCELPSDELNNLYAHFMASNTKACIRASAVLDDSAFSVANVSKTFKQVNIHKAAGPDELPERVLRA
jgi:hypothetical protein